MLLWLALATALVLLLAAAAGQYLVWPARRDVGPAPADIGARSVSIQFGHRQHVAGWLCHGTGNVGAVLLLHEMRGDRRSMLARLRFLSAQGFSVLAIDLPGHGESDGQCITLGHREALAAAAALDYLAHECDGQPLAVIGVSLGGAALLLANTRPQPSVVILESVFPTLAQAAMNRLRRTMGPLAPVVAPLMFVQLPFRFGISHRKLRPIAKVAQWDCATLVIGGRNDRETTEAETQALFDACNGPKQLWLIDGAIHEDLHVYAGAAYEAKVTAFLKQYLARARPGAAQATQATQATQANQVARALQTTQATRATPAAQPQTTVMVATVQPTENIGIGL